MFCFLFFESPKHSSNSPPLLLLLPVSSFSSRMDLMEKALLSGPPTLDCDDALELALLELELAEGDGILTSDSG